jgi:putative ABC transport system permease protein
VRLKNLSNPTVRYGNNVFKEKALFETDGEIFNVFTYHVLKGDPKTALEGHNGMVITKSFGEKYFGDDDPIDKLLIVNDADFQVTAVIQDLPPNSDIKFSALIAIDKTHQPEWFVDLEYHTFILFNENYLKQDVHALSFLPKLKHVADENINKKFTTKEEGRIDFLLQPFSTLHFREPLLLDTPKANMKYIYIIGSVALLVLFIGSLNFINFSLVQSLERGKEVAVRKIAGATYYQLILRYLMESAMLALLAFSVALLIVSLVLPYLKNITGMNFGLGELWSFKFIAAALGVILFEGILAGAYPAFFASSMKPLDSLRGKAGGPRGNTFRSASLIVQFSIAMGLILCTLLTSKQMDYLSNYDLGFTKDNIVVLNTPGDTLHARQLNVFKNSLLKNERIQKVSNLNYGSLPGEGGSKGQAGVKGKDRLKMVSFSRVDEDYLPILRIALKEGRNFDNSKPQDKVDAVIINESFQKAWGLTDPLNEKVMWGSEYTIIGVTKDFNLASLHSTIEPLLLFYNEKYVVNTLVAFDRNVPVSEQVSLLSEEWLSMFPNEPFQYRFLDDALAEQYINEERIVWLFTLFSALSIVVSLLGLFGLCSLTISQRKKEVAIRRIIGANFVSILLLFFKKYVTLICVSFVIIAPVAVLAMRQWLEAFPFKDTIRVSVFFITLLGTVVFALLTVMLSIFKTTVANPTTVVRE